MKNIHILPTDKPSRLHLAYSKDYYLSAEPFIQLDTKNYKSFNIYITSDEEIKENTQSFKEGLNGDWFYNTIYNFIARTGDITPYDFKIILTTNNLLIADGVQAIDDEFLEWFVKNPSCESVEVEQEKSIGYVVGNRQRTFYGKYKITIPKEEVFEMYSHLYGKTVTMDDRFETKHIWSEELSLKNKGRWIPQEEPKQETERGLIIKKSDGSIIEEPQQERMYSEEDMKQFAFECVGKFLSNDDNKVEIKLVDVIIDRLNKHFEQFKKK
jgi:hypothetical protein